MDVTGSSSVHQFFSKYCLSLAVVICLPTSVCQAGSSGAFTEEAVARGITYPVSLPYVGPWTYGFGAAFVDLDSDGDPDVVTVGRSSGEVGIYENDGTGNFTDRTAETNISFFDSKTDGVTAADYDGDGDLDLYFARWLGDDALLRNDGDYQFTDVTQESGLAGNCGAGTGCAWADFDNDGWLDLHVTNRSGTASNYTPNKLYRNLGDGTFEDVAPTMGLDDAWPTFQVVFFDSDRDGDVDLYLSTDKGYASELHNRIFENVDGEYVEISQQSGADIALDSMGVAVGDIDGNGFLDLYCTNTSPGNRLILNQGDNTFVEATEQSGVGAYSLGWGTHFFDYDLDRDVDLYACDAIDPNFLFENQPRWPLPNIAEAMNLNDPGSSYGLAAADIDDDGDIDLLVQNNQENSRLYVNHASPDQNWIKLRVDGRRHNLFAIGAFLDARTGEQHQIRQVAAGNTYKSQNDLTQHFGLGDAEIVDELEIVWPGGTPTRTLTNLPANQTWTLYPPERLGDADNDGDVDLLDFPVFADCFGVEDFAPGCELMDLTSNSVVDSLDYLQFLERYTWPITDCNDNGVADIRDILIDPSLDRDGNGLIDSCAIAPADFDASGEVGMSDLMILLQEWNRPTSPADLNTDNVVDGEDLGILLGQWG